MLLIEEQYLVALHIFVSFAAITLNSPTSFYPKSLKTLRYFHLFRIANLHYCFKRLAPFDSLFKAAVLPCVSIKFMNLQQCTNDLGPKKIGVANKVL